MNRMLVIRRQVTKSWWTRVPQDMLVISLLRRRCSSPWWVGGRMGKGHLWWARHDDEADDDEGDVWTTFPFTRSLSWASTRCFYRLSVCLLPPLACHRPKSPFNKWTVTGNMNNNRVNLRGWILFPPFSSSFPEQRLLNPSPFIHKSLLKRPPINMRVNGIFQSLTFPAFCLSFPSENSLLLPLLFQSTSKFIILLWAKPQGPFVEEKGGGGRIAGCLVYLCCICLGL